MTMIEQWRLDVVAHGGRLLVAALDATDDSNEAHLMVHGIMANALDDIASPISGESLDADLTAALRVHDAA